MRESNVGRPVASFLAAALAARSPLPSPSLPHLLPLQQVRRHRRLGRALVHLALLVALLVHGDRLLHRRLLGVPLLGKELALQAERLLRKRGPLVHLPGLPLAQALMVVQPVPIPLAVEFDVVALGHCEGAGVVGWRGRWRRAGMLEPPAAGGSGELRVEEKEARALRPTRAAQHTQVGRN